MMLYIDDHGSISNQRDNERLKKHVKTLAFSRSTPKTGIGFQDAQIDIGRNEVKKIII